MHSIILPLQDIKLLNINATKKGRYFAELTTDFNSLQEHSKYTSNPR